MHQPDPGEALADLLDGPLDPPGWLGGHRGVVQDVPGLHEAAGSTLALAASSPRPSIDRVDRVVAVGLDGAEARTRGRPLGVRGAVEVVAESSDCVRAAQTVSASAAMWIW